MFNPQKSFVDLTLLYRAFGPFGVEYLEHVEQLLFPVDALVPHAVDVSSTVVEPIDARATGMAGTGSASAEVSDPCSCAPHNFFILVVTPS